MSTKALKRPADTDALPDKAALDAMLAPVRAFMRGGGRVREHLARLAENPPQALLLEGGTAEERLAAADYFSLLLNCRPAGAPSTPAPQPGTLFPPGPATPENDGAPEVQPEHRPCLTCPSCLRFISRLHRDCFFFDGREASIKIDDVRALRQVLGEAPREAARRMVVFCEAQALVEAAANALLKSFEEPRPGTSFILLAPQRERLLPTLVSRSFCLTLPWPPPLPEGGETEDLRPWEEAFLAFLRTGRDFFEHSGGKGAVSPALAHGILNMCGRALARCLLARQKGDGSGSGGPGNAGSGLADILALLPDERLRMADEALAECRDSLLFGVGPGLVIEWLITRLYLLLPRTAAGELRTLPDGGNTASL